MRQLCLLLFFFAALPFSHPVFSSGTEAAAIRIKGNDKTGVPAIPQLLSDILEITGHAGEFELKEADVPNLEADIVHGKRYILYNVKYTNWLNTVTHDKWATLTLLAHEVAHHLKGHTKRRSGSRPRLELQADEYAGFILQQLGASLEQTQEVMKHIAKPKASRTHPSRAARLEAIEKGWNRAAALYAGNGR